MLTRVYFLILYQDVNTQLANQTTLVSLQASHNI